ncbi:MAG: hypothetical protein WA996_24565 [Candidatus Promineifilaceae bacterium]
MMELYSFSFFVRVILFNALTTSAGVILVLAAVHTSRKTLVKARRNQGRTE